MSAETAAIMSTIAMVRPASCQRRAGLALLAGPSGRLGLLRTTGLFGEDEPVSADGANPGDDPDVPDGAAVAGADAPIGGGTWPVGDAGPVLGAAVAGGAVAGGAVAGGALVGGTATDGAATDGAATDGAATDRAAATGGEAAGGTATRGTATRGVVMGSAVTGGAVMGGSAATAAAAAISAADVARSKLAAEAASDVGDGAPASQLADGGSALGRAVAGGALTGVVVAAGWPESSAAGPVWPRGSARLMGIGRRAVGGVWIALAPGERCGSEPPGRGGSAGPWSRACDCLAAADPRAGRKPRRTCPGVSPFAPGTRRGSSDGSSCGGGRLSSAMRRTPQLQ